MDRCRKTSWSDKLEERLERIPFEMMEVDKFVEWLQIKNNPKATIIFRRIKMLETK